MKHRPFHSMQVSHTTEVNREYQDLQDPLHRVILKCSIPRTVGSYVWGKKGILRFAHALSYIYSKVATYSCEHKSIDPSRYVPLSLRAFYAFFFFCATYPFSINIHFFFVACDMRYLWLLHCHVVDICKNILLVWVTILYSRRQPSKGVYVKRVVCFSSMTSLETEIVLYLVKFSALTYNSTMSSLLGIYKVRFLRLIFLSLVHCYSGCFRAAVQVCATPLSKLSVQDQRMDPRNKVKQLKI